MNSQNVVNSAMDDQLMARYNDSLIINESAGSETSSTVFGGLADDNLIDRKSDTYSIQKPSHRVPSQLGSQGGRFTVLPAVNRTTNNQVNASIYSVNSLNTEVPHNNSIEHLPNVTFYSSTSTNTEAYSNMTISTRENFLQDSNIPDNVSHQVNVNTSSQFSKQKSSSMKKRVSFPEGQGLIKGFAHAPNPWYNVSFCTTENLMTAYNESCRLHGVRPILKLTNQLKTIKDFGERINLLTLKGENLNSKHIETLEEIFRRVQFTTIDLEGTHLDDESAISLFEMVEYYESVVHLKVSQNKNLGMRAWLACSRMIRKTPCLESLDICGCSINEQSVAALGRSLRMGAFITVLHMRECNLACRGVMILSAALRTISVIKELHIGENNLQPADGIQIGNLLRNNTYLHTLDVRNNNLQDVGVAHICDGLAEQPGGLGLQTLIIANNHITYHCMPSMVTALTKTKSLSTLNLSNNQLTNEGIYALKEGLLKNKSLVKLSLRSIKLSCEGAVALAEFIADSYTLSQLDLRENDIKTAGLIALSMCLRVHQTVTRLDLDLTVKKEQGVKDYQSQQKFFLDEIQSQCNANAELARSKLEKLLPRSQSLEENVSLPKSDTEPPNAQTSDSSPPIDPAKFFDPLGAVTLADESNLDHQKLIESVELDRASDTNKCEDSELKPPPSPTEPVELGRTSYICQGEDSEQKLPALISEPVELDRVSDICQGEDLEQNPHDSISDSYNLPGGAHSTIACSLLESNIETSPLIGGMTAYTDTLISDSDSAYGVFSFDQYKSFSYSVTEPLNGDLSICEVECSKGKVFSDEVEPSQRDFLENGGTLCNKSDMDRLILTREETLLAENKNASAAFDDFLVLPNLLVNTGDAPGNASSHSENAPGIIDNIISSEDSSSDKYRCEIEEELNANNSKIEEKLKTNNSEIEEKLNTNNSELEEKVNTNDSETEEKLKAINTEMEKHENLNNCNIILNPNTDICEIEHKENTNSYENAINIGNTSNSSDSKTEVTDSTNILKVHEAVNRNNCHNDGIPDPSIFGNQAPKSTNLEDAGDTFDSFFSSDEKAFSSELFSAQITPNLNLCETQKTPNTNNFLSEEAAPSSFCIDDSTPGSNISSTEDSSSLDTLVYGAASNLARKETQNALLDSTNDAVTLTQQISLQTENIGGITNYPDNKIE